MTSVGAELFATETHSPIALCKLLLLPWGQKLRAWDDLLWGGHDKFPVEVPSEISTTLVARDPLGDGDSDWELRAVRVEAIGNATTPFHNGWPFSRPADAVRPLSHA